MEYIDDINIGQSPSRVREIRRQDHYFARREDYRLAIDGQFQLAFNDVYDLLVYMGVFRQDCSGVEADVSDAQIVSIDNSGANFISQAEFVQLVKINEWHSQFLN
jgi:hypothetical protein